MSLVLRYTLKHTGIKTFKHVLLVSITFKIKLSAIIYAHVVIASEGCKCDHNSLVLKVIHWPPVKHCPDNKMRGANMGPTWGRHDPGGPHAGPIKLDIRVD